MRVVSVSAAILFLGAGSALAQAQPQGLSQPTTTPVSTDVPANAANQSICKTMYHNGTMIRTQTCHTAAEWEAIRRSNQREVQQMQMRSLTSQPR